MSGVHFNCCVQNFHSNNLIMMPHLFSDGSQIMYSYLVNGILNFIVLLFCLSFLAKEKFHLHKTRNHQRSAGESPKPFLMLSMLFGIPVFFYGEWSC